MLQTPPTLAITGSFSIDAVLASDGRWTTDKIGGNALWSAFGAYVCGLTPRILTIVGTDYPSHVLETLSGLGFDLSAIRRIDRSHPVRVSFAHLADGSRIQPVPEDMIASLPAAARAGFVDTTSQPDVLPLGAPTGDDVPEAWLQDVDFWHLPLLPLERHRQLVARLAGARGYIQSDCPARSDLRDAPFDGLMPTLAALNTFLPSTSDFDVIAPTLGRDEIMAALSHAGARAIVLKAGGDGVVFDKDGTLFRMPAYARAPVDPTGAGDAFCGGFLAGMALTGDILEAAAFGSAAASFAVATENPLDLAQIAPGETAERARTLLEQTEPFTAPDGPRRAVRADAGESVAGK